MKAGRGHIAEEGSSMHVVRQAAKCLELEAENMHIFISNK